MLTPTVDPLLPPLPTRLTLARALLEHDAHLAALDIICTAREEDSLEVESAYLEGWAWYLRAQALEGGLGAVAGTAGASKDKDDGGVAGDEQGKEGQGEGKEEEEEDDDKSSEELSPSECLSESMRALIECAALFSEQEYPDEGIGGHVGELLDELKGRGVVPNIVNEDEGEGEGGKWEDVEMK